MNSNKRCLCSVAAPEHTTSLRRGPHRDVLVRIEVDTGVFVLEETINLCVQGGRLHQSSVFGAEYSKGSYAALRMHQ